MALACYPGFEKRNFKVCALFDKQPKLLGVKVRETNDISDIQTIPRLVKEKEIEILILAVPAEAIKEIHDMVMLSGVKAVLNFAPFKLLSTEDVEVHNVDLTTELEFLSYSLNLRDEVKTDAGEEVFGVPTELL